MQIEDTTTLRGDLQVTIRSRTKGVIERFEEKNMIVNAAKTTLAQLIAGDAAAKSITHIGFGTGSAAATPTDTSLTNAFWRPISSFSYPKAGQVKFNFILATTEANGKTIREFGLRTSTGQLFSRKVRGAIEKNDDISLEGSWTITF